MLTGQVWHPIDDSLLPQHVAATALLSKPRQAADTEMCRIAVPTTLMHNQ
jgi:hypothetical protein